MWSQANVLGRCSAQAFLSAILEDHVYRAVLVHGYEVTGVPSVGVNSRFVQPRRAPPATLYPVTFFQGRTSDADSAFELRT